MHVFVVTLSLGILLSGCAISEEAVSNAPMVDSSEQQPDSAEKVEAAAEYGLWYLLEEETSLGENNFVFTLESETDEGQRMSLVVACSPEQTLLVGALLSSGSFQFPPDQYLDVEVRFDDSEKEKWYAYGQGPFVRAFSSTEVPINTSLSALDLQFLNKLSSHDALGVRVFDVNGSHTAKFPITGVRAIAEKVSASSCLPE